MDQAKPAVRNTFRKEDRNAKIALKRLAENIRPTVRFSNGSKTKKLRILSIDGGGIRALLPAVILAKLEERLQLKCNNAQARIVDHFDLFAGTSAGGVLTALYLTPDPVRPWRPKYSAREVLEIYLKDGGTGFTPANPDKKKSRKEKYSAPILESQLQYFLGKETSLGQFVKPAMITAFNVDAERPVYFNSWESKNCKAWQVVRATTAAPGLFQAARFEMLENGMQLIDGSVFASNPAMCAYTLANHTRFSKLSNCNFGRDFPTLDNMLLLSVGTGKMPKLGEKAGSVMRILMKNCMSSSSELIDFQLKQLFSDRRKGLYYRFNPRLPVIETAIDEVQEQNIKSLYTLALSYLEEENNKLDQLVVSLLS